jgi:effector-binding domain-containing protein
MEMYWVEFTAIFDQKRKKVNRSPSQMFDTLSKEIRLSKSTLASFYHHKTTPMKTSMDKIISWIEKKGKKVVSNSSSNEISNS